MILYVAKFASELVGLGGVCRQNLWRSGRTLDKLNWVYDELLTSDELAYEVRDRRMSDRLQILG